MKKEKQMVSADSSQAAVVLEKPDSQLLEMWRALIQNKAAVLGLCIIVFLVFLALFGRFIMPYDPNMQDMGNTLAEPSNAHLFGTDQLGRDIFSRVIDGTKISLRVGLSAVAIALSIGTVLGAVAGYRGGKTDTIIMRIMDMMLSIPSILLAITFMAALGKGIDKAIIAIGLVSIPASTNITAQIAATVTA